MWSRLLSMGSEQEPEKNEQDFHCKNVLLILGDGGHSKLNFVSSLLPFEKNESYITHKEDDNDYNRSNPHFFSYRQIKFSDLKSNISSKQIWLFEDNKYFDSVIDVYVITDPSLLLSFKDQILSTSSKLSCPLNIFVILTMDLNSPWLFPLLINKWKYNLDIFLGPCDNDQNNFPPSGNQEKMDLLDADGRVKDTKSMKVHKFYIIGLNSDSIEKKIENQYEKEIQAEYILYYLRYHCFNTFHNAGLGYLINDTFCLDDEEGFDFKLELYRNFLLPRISSEQKQPVINLNRRQFFIPHFWETTRSFETAYRTSILCEKDNDNDDSRPDSVQISSINIVDYNKIVPFPIDEKELLPSSVMEKENHKSSKNKSPTDVDWLFQLEHHLGQDTIAAEKILLSIINQLSSSQTQKSNEKEQIHSPSKKSNAATGVATRRRRNQRSPMKLPKTDEKDAKSFFEDLLLDNN